jgi:hypothetical protein
MPKITEVHLIDITPEKFLENCSLIELNEIEHLIQTKRFQDRMEKDPDEYPDIDEITDSNLLTCH